MIAKKRAHLAFVVGVLVIIFGAYFNIEELSEKTIAIDGEIEIHIKNTLSLLKHISTLETHNSIETVNVEVGSGGMTYERTTINNIHFEFVFEGRENSLGKHFKQFKPFETQYLNPFFRNISKLIIKFRTSSKMNYISSLSTTYRRSKNGKLFRCVKVEDLISAMRHGGGASTSIASGSKLSTSVLSFIIVIPKTADLTLDTVDWDIEDETESLSWTLDKRRVIILNQHTDISLMKPLSSIVLLHLRGALGLGLENGPIMESELNSLLLSHIQSSREIIGSYILSIEHLMQEGGRMWTQDISIWKIAATKLISELGDEGSIDSLSRQLYYLTSAEDIALTLQRSVTLHAGESYFPLEHMAAIFLPMWMPLALPLLSGFFSKAAV